MNVTDQTKRIERSARALSRAVMDSAVNLVSSCEDCRTWIPRGDFCAQHRDELLDRLKVRIRDLCVRASVYAESVKRDRVSFEVDMTDRESEPCRFCGAPIVMVATGKRNRDGTATHAPMDVRTELPTDRDNVFTMENHFARCTAERPPRRS